MLAKSVYVYSPFTHSRHWSMCYTEQKQQHAFLSNIHTVLDASESNSGFIILSNLACRLEQLGIKPKTLQLVDDLLYLLSYSHSINVDKQPAKVQEDRGLK